MRMTAAYQKAARTKVRRGLKFLNKTHPRWWTAIDLNILNMESSRLCILGQCFSDFFKALEGIADRDMSRDHVWAARHGFDVEITGNGAPNGAYEYLTLLWADIIIKLQVKAGF